MANYFTEYLELGTVEEISDKLRSDGTNLEGPNGAAARTACAVIVGREIQATLLKIDQATQRMQSASLIVATTGLAVAIVGMVVAIVST